MGSRYVSLWLNLTPPGEVGRVLVDGSPIDRAVFLALIVGAMVVLVKRGAKVGDIIAGSPWLFLFIAFCFLSASWSEFPLVSLKRSVKLLGHPLMTMVLLTEVQPLQAVQALGRRTAYLLVPLSVTFIKYYPAYGRGYSEWTGQAFYTGVTDDKNALGYLCLFCGLLCSWSLLSALRDETPATRKPKIRVLLILLATIGWLLWKANSATATSSLALGCALMFALQRKWISPRGAKTYLPALFLGFFLLDAVFGISAELVGLLGRDPTLTGRTELWETVLGMQGNRWIGTGYESFFLGQRLKVLWSRYWWRPNQAHSGYLETYLNLGWVGVFLLGGMIVACFRRAIQRLEVRDNLDGAFRIGALATVVAYNVTEAAFSGLHLVLFLFFIVAVRSGDDLDAEQGAELPLQEGRRGAYDYRARPSVATAGHAAGLHTEVGRRAPKALPQKRAGGPA